MPTRNVPTLAEVYKDVETAKHYDDLNVLLNQPPPEKWLRKHPMASNVKYLPIDKVEYLLTRIFQQWKVEVLTVQALFNSVQVTVRLHVFNPQTEEWTYQDGVGATPVQTEKGASAADLGAIKNNAIQLAVPSAKSYAIKDAAEHFGAIFGRDLNRKDTIMFTGSFDKDVKAPTETIDTHYDEPSIQIGNGTPVPTSTTSNNDFIL